MDIQITSPRYVNADHTLYDVTVTLDGATIDYTVAPDDDAPLAVAIRAVMAADPLPIADYVAPPPRPLDPLNAKQIRLGLLAMGITEDDIEAKLGLLDEPGKTQALIAWRYAPSYVRTDPLLVQIAAALELDDETIDQFWRAAMAL